VNEHREDEIVGGEPMLAHEPAGKIVAAHAALPPLGEFSCESHGSS